jgi:hypothetical protein
LPIDIELRVLPLNSHLHYQLKWILILKVDLDHAFCCSGHGSDDQQTHGPTHPKCAYIDVQGNTINVYVLQANLSWIESAVPATTDDRLRSVTLRRRRWERQTLSWDFEFDWLLSLWPYLDSPDIPVGDSGFICLFILLYRCNLPKNISRVMWDWENGKMSLFFCSLTLRQNLTCYIKIAFSSLRWQKQEFYTT